MNFDDLTIGELKTVLAWSGKQRNQGPWVVGEKYLIRTVTHYLTGKLVSVGEHELSIDDAAWVADTGRFADALKTGNLKEVEPISGLVIVGRGSIVDAEIWVFGLPREQK